jgi:hypothetical protein
MVVVGALTADPGVSLPDPRHYADHLAGVVDEHPVLVRRDIVHADGSVLVSAGRAFDRELLDRIAGRPLVALLSRSVEIRGGIGPDAIVNVWARLREAHTDLHQLEQRMGIADDFETVARSAPLPPEVWQIATVMFARRPDWFRLAVLGGWFAVALAREAGFVDVDVLRAFAAGFSRDLGFLFIDARHIDKPGYLEDGTGAWRTIQGHVDTGRQVWAESDAQPAWAAAVGRSIYEHHERVNGTGYPDRVDPEALDDVGQIVGMADLLASVRLKRFGESGRNLQDTIPIVLVSSDCFPKQVLDATVRAISRAGLRGTTLCDLPSKSELVDRLVSRAYGLRNAARVLAELPSFEPVVPRGREPPPPGPLTRAVSTTVQMLARSGVAQSELGAWLDAVRNGRATARMHELCEMDLQQGEALWRVEQIRRLLVEHYEVHQPRANSPAHRALNALESCMSV